MDDLADIAERIEAGAATDADAAALRRAARKQVAVEPPSLRRGRRDAILRHMAATYCAGMSINEQANEIGKAARRYEATSWRFEAHEIENPRPRGTIEHEIWNALTAYPLVPADRQMRTILSA